LLATPLAVMAQDQDTTESANNAGLKDLWLLLLHGEFSPDRNVADGFLTLEPGTGTRSCCLGGKPG
jgi:hypothetical protein